MPNNNFLEELRKAWPVATVIAVIAVVALVALIRLFKLAQMVGAQEKSFTSVREKHNETKTKSTSLQGELKAGDGDDAVVRRLKTLATYTPAPDMLPAADAALSDEQSRVWEREMGGVRFAAGVLLFLGLLGTLVGLWQTVGKLQGILIRIDSVDALNQMLGSIRAVFGEAKLAFSGTLSGVFFSTLINIGAFFVAREHLVKVQEPLDKLCLQLIPRLADRPDPMADTLNKMKTAFDLLEPTLNNLRESAETQIAAGNALATQMAVASKELSKKMGVAGTTLEKAGDALRDLAAKTDRWITDLDTAVRGSLEQLNERHEQTRDLLTDLAKVAQAASEQAAAAQHMTRLAEGAAETITDDAARRVQEWTEGAGAQLEEHLTAHRESLNAILTQFETARAAIETIRTGADSVHRDAEQVITHATNTFGAQANHILLEQQRETAHTLGQIETAITALEKELRSTLSKMGRAQEALADLAEGADASLKDTLDELRTARGAKQ